MSSAVKSICNYIELLTQKQSSNREHDKTFTNLEVELKSRIDVVLQILLVDRKICQEVENISPALLTSVQFNMQFEIRWTFIEWCLVFLTLLKNLICSSCDQRSCHIGSLKNQPVMLSISEEKTVLSAMQFIVALGIAPGLLQGVGIPLHKRSQLGKVFQEHQDSTTPQQKHRRLVACTVIILNYISQPALGSIILRYHFIDLLSALFQLCYAPIKRTSSTSASKDNSSINMQSLANQMKFAENIESVGNAPSVAMLLKRVRDPEEQSEEQLISEMWEDRNNLTYELEKLIKRTYKPLLISTLLQLQGSRVSQQQAGRHDTLYSPKWMRKTCGVFLSKELMQPQGVLSVIEGMLLLGGRQDEGTEKWEKYEAVGEIIAHAPSCTSSPEVYYKTISPQILSLLQTKGMEANRIAHWITICTISSMLEHKPALTEKYIFNPLLKALKCCLVTLDNPLCNEHNGTVLANEKELALTINSLHKIVLCGFTLSPHVHNKLVSVFIPLFDLLCFTLEGVFHLRQKIEDIVTVLLKSSDDPVQLLFDALFDVYLLEKQAMRMDIRFEYGEEASIRIIKDEVSRFRSEDLISGNIKKCSCGMYLLQKLNDKKLTGKAFFLLLQELQEALKDSGNKSEDAVKLQNTLLDIENDIQLVKLHKNLLLLQLIQEIAEQFGDVIVEDSSQAIEFIQTTLSRCTTFYKVEDHLGTETVSLVLGALAMLVTQKDKLKSEDWRRMKNCIPSLQNVISNFQGDIKTTAQELITIIATHGAAGREELRQRSNRGVHGNTSEKKLEVALTDKCHSTNRNVKCNKKPDSDRVDDICANPDQNGPDDSQNLTPRNSDEGKISPYQALLEELNDNLLPVRGHAMIQLRKLILSRDSETLRNSDKLIDIFMEFLFDTDSYIFLPAIQCLSALGMIYADKVIPVLSEQFGEVGRPNDLKLKIAEALMHIIRALGELNPKYRDTLLPLFLCGTKDADPQMRASSLSNLGEICQRLKYALGPYLQEILMCVQSYLRTDSSVEVRRAAVLTLSLLLRGLGSDSLRILEEEMRDLYRLLKLCYASETDDVVKLHIQIALEEINIFIKENFCSQRPLIKEIKICHP